jgi:hypothetical protein
LVKVAIACRTDQSSVALHPSAFVQLKAVDVVPCHQLFNQHDFLRVPCERKVTLCPRCPSTFTHRRPTCAVAAA